MLDRDAAIRLMVNLSYRKLLCSVLKDTKSNRVKFDTTQARLQWAIKRFFADPANERLLRIIKPSIYYDGGRYTGLVNKLSKHVSFSNI